MDKDAFIQQVSSLRKQGTSIRAIALKLGVHPSRVQRAVAKLSSLEKDTIHAGVSYFRQGSGFVGREDDVALLRKSLDEAVAGHGNLILLSGEPGIGKTRLAQELCSYAGTREVSSYWGRCHEELQAPPFWPWIQILRSYIQKHRPSRIRSEMGTAAADIAGIAPRLIQNSELLQKLPDLKPTPPLNDPSEDRLRLFDSVSGFLNRSSKRQPMLLILDNLQWCDEPSLMFLRFVSQELISSRILVVCSYRNVSLEHEPGLVATLGALSRQPSFQQLELKGLTWNETVQMVRAQGSPDYSQEFMESIYSRTEGNPLFIIHIVQSLVKGSGLTGQGNSSDLTRIGAVPDSLYLAISRNMSYLSTHCQELLTTASAIGSHFNRLILRRIHKDLRASELQDLLDEAVAGGIIGRSNPKSEWYRFNHSLVQEAILSGITTKQSVDLHARIGLALEGIYEKYRASIAAQLAYHFGKSVDLTGFDKAIYYSRMAAENAFFIFAHEEAVRHFQRAIEIKRKKTPSAANGIPDDETAEIILSLIKALAAMSVWKEHEPFKLMSQLMNYYMDKKDIASIIELASIPMIMSNRVSVSELKRRFEQILNIVETDSSEFGWILCIFGYFIGVNGGECEAAQDAFNRALVIARKHNDQNMEMRALVNTVLVKALHWEVDWDILLRVIDMAERFEDRQVEAIGRFYHVAFATTTTQFNEAENLWERAMSAATHLRHRMLLNALTSTGQVLALYYGDFQTSRFRSELAITGHERSPASQIIRAITEYELGRLEVGDRFARQAVEVMESNPDDLFVEYGWSVAQLPFLSYLTGKDKWSEFEDKIINLVLKDIPQVKFFNIMAHVGLSLRAINRGDIATARQAYNELKVPLKSDPIRRMISPIAMSSDRLLGLLCFTFEDYDRAIGHFHDAIEFCRECGFLPQLAWSCYDCSRAMLRRNNPGDSSRANTMVTEALSVSNELGMKLLVERVKSMTDIKVSKKVHAAASNDFTGREIDILKLLAEGKTNREIAQELVISTHTAATHVRNILKKGNLANRVEAAALAVRYYSAGQ